MGGVDCTYPPHWQGAMHGREYPADPTSARFRSRVSASVSVGQVFAPRTSPRTRPTGISPVQERVGEGT